MKTKIQTAILCQPVIRQSGICGLLAICRYYDRAPTVQQLRRLRELAAEDQTLTGLYRAGNVLELSVLAQKITSEALQALDGPCLLACRNGGQVGYRVLWAREGSSTYLISEPGSGDLQEVEENELRRLWNTSIAILIDYSAFPGAKSRHTFRYWLRAHLLDNRRMIIFLMGISGLICVGVLYWLVLLAHLPARDFATGPDFPLLYPGVGLLLLLVGLLLNFIRRFLVFRLREALHRRWEQQFVQQQFLLAPGYFKHYSSEDLQADRHTVRKMSSGMATIISDALLGGWILIGAVFLIAWFSPWSGVFSLVWCVLVMSLYQRNWQQLRKEAASSFPERPPLESFFHRFHFHFNLPRRHSPGSGIQREFRSIQQAVGRKSTMAFIRNNRGLFGIESAIALGLAVLSGSVYVHLAENRLSSINFTAVLLLLLALGWALYHLLPVPRHLSVLEHGFRRLGDLISEPEAVSPAASTKKAGRFQHLKLKQLSFRYPGAAPIFEDLDFSIRSGEAVLVSGPMGSGKTTLLRLICRPDLVGSGQVRINGADAKQAGNSAWNAQINWAPPSPPLLTGATVLENILLGEPIKNLREVEAFLQHYGFMAYFQNLPQGIHTRLGADGGVCASAGEQKLIGLARVLWQRPQLLLLDEPEAGLDEESRLFLRRLIGQLKKEMAVLMVSTNDALSPVADRHYCISHKKLQVQAGVHTQTSA